MTEWTDATAVAEQVRKGEISAVEAASHAIAKIEARDGEIGALVSERFEQALDEAAALDAAPGRKTSAAFAGVPFLVKDLSFLKGAPLTFGSRLFRDYIARETEPVIQAALDSGFIALGKSKTPEFGLIGTTEPLEFGPTRNPWDLSLSPGGSSGGAAAAVASGMVPFAHASDGGGSIRIPASACGLVGLKPSRGRALPPKRSAPGGLSATFCVSRSVRDTARFLEICDAARFAAAGDDDVGPAEIGYVGEPPARPLKIALAPKSIADAEPDDEVSEALAAAAKLCAELGHTVEAAAPSFNGPAAIEHFVTFWSAIPAQIERNFTMIRAMTCGPQVWRWPTWEEALDPWTRGLCVWFKEREARHPGAMDAARRFFKEAAREYEAFFQNYDVMLTPVTRRARLPLGEQTPTVPFDTLLAGAIDNIGYTPVQNAIGAPAISLPLHWLADGAPVGLQFAARRHDERTLLQLAHQLEEAAPWAHRRPPCAREA